MKLVLQTGLNIGSAKYDISINIIPTLPTESKKLCAEVQQEIVKRVLPYGDKYNGDNFNDVVNKQIIQDIFKEIRSVSEENRVAINVQHIQRRNI